MDHDFDMSLTVAMGKLFGHPLQGWPASTRYVHPYLGIIVRSVGLDGAVGLFGAARQAYLREQEAERIGGYQFGFAAYLSTEMGDVEPTLDLAAAGEAIKAVHEIARRDSGADFGQYIDCAIAACARAVPATV
ncbi:hypothetical protein ACWDDN_46615 [Streptomyces griseoruber]|uniref:hypothetical protein n=1 Tax=Streptomyces griseoruber TaxID=1943 RepID=UPI0006E39501|nr:hypothetical protein [Streptomyces griseoruber]